jgi:hypothetical protein
VAPLRTPRVVSLPKKATTKGYNLACLVAALSGRRIARWVAFYRFFPPLRRLSAEAGSPPAIPSASMPLIPAGSSGSRCRIATYSTPQTATRQSDDEMDALWFVMGLQEASR